MEGFMINKLESSSLNGVHQRTRRTGAQFRKDGVVLEGLGTVLSSEGLSLEDSNFFLHPKLVIKRKRILPSLLPSSKFTIFLTPTSYSFFQTYETFFSHHYKYPLFSEGYCSFVEDLIQKTNFNSQIWTWKANRRKTHTAAGRKRWIVLKLQSCANYEIFLAKNNVEESQNLY